MVDLPNTVLPCLSFWNPWAWSLFRCEKDVENRPWNSRCRGWLVVQVAMHWKIEEVTATLLAIKKAVEISGRPQPNIDMHEIKNQCGKIIGMVKIDDWKPAISYKSPWAFKEGYGAHVVQAVEFDRMITAPGRQRWFYLQEEIERKVRAEFHNACQKQGL